MAKRVAYNQEFNRWMESKERLLEDAEQRIELVLNSIKRLADGEDIDLVLGERR